MDTAHIIQELENRLNNITQAIKALQGNRGAHAQKKTASDGRKVRRRLTTAQRKKIGEAMKKKWAERKKNAV
jgi:hypothetical protein